MVGSSDESVNDIPRCFYYNGIENCLKMLLNAKSQLFDVRINLYNNRVTGKSIFRADKLSSQTY